MINKNSLKKILYVEDDKASLLLISHLLRNNFEMDGASNAESALEKVKRNQYDLILLDIKLGPIGKSGLEVLKEIREIPEYDAVPIIAVTAYAMAGDREEILRKGCNDYVSKPVDFKKLKHAINRQMENKDLSVQELSTERH